MLILQESTPLSFSRNFMGRMANYIGKSLKCFSGGDGGDILVFTLFNSLSFSSSRHHRALLLHFTLKNKKYFYWLLVTSVLASLLKY